MKKLLIVDDGPLAGMRAMLQSERFGVEVCGEEARPTGEGISRE